MRNLLSRSFADAGFYVETAEDGEEGLEKIGNAKTPFDLYFTDNNMGCGMSGIDFLEQVQDHKVFKVFATGDPDGVLLREAVRLGANMTVEKPVSSLAGLVQEIYQGIREYKSLRA
jgi:CheY-like chemotaxis protein